MSDKRNPINPNEGRPAEVDASGWQPGIECDHGYDACPICDQQQPDARHGLYEDYLTYHREWMENDDMESLDRHVVAMGKALDAQAAEIAELRNTVRNSLSEIRRLHPENAALRAALDRYGDHDIGCPAHMTHPDPDKPEGPCDCGYVETCAALKGDQR